ncbi:MAG TPA: non-canonical purine NTP pyrophosphatase [Candidatus Limnocylindrales bacterium]|jgi:XTP/dITP diphosphohydrolase
MSQRSRRLLIATHSRHKLRELRELLDVGDDVELVSPDDLGIGDEPEETGETFETNARLKARFYARRSGLPTLADDSGLEVDALDGAPGVRTRRYAGPAATDEANNAKLLGALAGRPAPERGARYVCVLALALPDEAGPRGGISTVVRRGTCRGRIALGPKGDGGFGYDPIFEPDPEPPGGRTLGEWSAAEKNAISHRSRAARRMALVLRELGF